MPDCPFCDHPNPTGAERCEHCGAWVVGGEEPKAGRVNLPMGGELEGRVRTLMAEGRKIEAIKVYREATGAGLKEAKDAVEGLDLRGGPSHRPNVGQDIEPELLSLLEQGEKIRAIKVYRERTGVGLKEAKDAVEALGRRHGIVPKGAGCGGLLLLTLILSGLMGLMIGGLV